MHKFLLSFLLVCFGCHGVAAWAAHAFSLYGTPKYPAGFTHFDYVNSDAPKRGELYLANPDRRTSFDKFNPFSLKGVSAAGVSELMFESLTTSSSDEVATMYGLLAEDMVLAPDRMSMTFRLNSKARFNNGDPVTAVDVKHSFDTLKEKGAPQFKIIFADVVRCVVIDGRTVRFDFASLNHELPLIVGGIPVFSKKWGANTSFDKIQLEAPIASGPYLIDRYDVGRTITYKRNPAYWGNDLPSRRGMFNFKRIHYIFFKDDLARLEAFKAGDFDVVVENSAKNWARNYIGPKFKSGEIVKRALKHSNGASMQGFMINLRKPQFKDVRVRQALGLALDYEWMNRQLFYGQYKRSYSFFNNSEFAATGIPSTAELRLLEPLRAMLDPAVFGPAPVPPVTDPPSSLRENLVKARSLFREAGWEYSNGALRNARGQPFTLEIIDDQGSMSRVISVYVRNLQKLGVQVNQRTADYALIQRRMQEFDFEMTTSNLGSFTYPGNELFSYFSSSAADEKGSSNIWGVKDSAVDKLVTAVVNAATWEDLVAASRALDRVLLHKFIVVPHWYLGTHRVAYHNRFGIPDVVPKYYQADSYVLSSWWENKPR